MKNIKLKTNKGWVNRIMVIPIATILIIGFFTVVIPVTYWVITGEGYDEYMDSIIDNLRH